MVVKQAPDSVFEFNLKEDISRIKLGIVVSEWNPGITESLLEACKKTFIYYGILEENILIKWVPGSFELALGAQFLFEFQNIDGVACLGCIIKGETPHFHYISDSVANNIGQLSLKYNRPVSFGVITAEVEDHAKERAGGNKGNKGEEAALAVLKMLKIKDEIKRSGRTSLGY